jgi:hypothetical protein
MKNVFAAVLIAAVSAFNFAPAQAQTPCCGYPQGGAYVAPKITLYPPAPTRVAPPTFAPLESNSSSRSRATVPYSPPVQTFTNPMYDAMTREMGEYLWNGR